MTQLAVPAVRDLTEIGDELGQWQSDDGPAQLHPGDLGWYSLRGAGATAGDLRVWRSGESTLAVGLLDGANLLRLAIHPSLLHDDSLAQDIQSAVEPSPSEVFAHGTAIVEARGATALCDRLVANGWSTDEPWTPLQRDLSRSVEDPGMTVVTAGIREAEEWASVHWSAFRGTPYTEDDTAKFIGRWRTMSTGPFSSRARSLLGYDDSGQPVAAATVWSAGPARPGLLEPVAVHRDHQGRGFGKAMAIAAAKNLQQMGASAASVAAETANTAAVATYSAAGFIAHAEVRDLRRGG
ncbi:GNAT family N-acetyltransferase [Brevibacterium marinum]|uniref:Ribosomal protein S18 acetylase RimI-like enzyme n=1 Tax=Brevibacterium marinum TaxID=418643 RepID=A0A846S5U1_9MICO|nr:GNAT family N-acetyltransferase [Brevibacterium marinum]NJC58403.1 ribosomal protein S18 acetylase RimI-like enzyme [Brevibacterium marinum]